MAIEQKDLSQNDEVQASVIPNLPERQPQIEANTTPDGKFTPEHIGRLFFESFRFSQGNPAAQERIFQYLSERFGAKLSPELIDQGVSMAAPRIIGFVSRGIKHASRGSSQSNLTINNERNDWIQAQQQDETETSRYDPLELLKLVLERDNGYATRERPNRNGYTAKTSRSDSPHLSHFVFYGLLGEDTGCAEYNEMFSELVANLPEVPERITESGSGEWFSLLPILEHHFDYYPEDVQRITPQGITALCERLDEAELQRIGVASI